jgi:hypothetical protein
MDMLQGHFQEVHMKQPSSTVKGILLDKFEFLFENFSLGFFSLAKQKIKSVQDNFTTIPNEQINIYAPYFSFDQNDSSLKEQQQKIGYSCSHNEKFKTLRKHKHDQISIETTCLLLRLARLTSNDENAPKNTNPKERRSMNSLERFL